MSIKNKLKSIHVKTLLYLVFFTTAIVLLLWSFQSVFLGMLYEKYQLKVITNLAEEIYNTSNNDLRDTLSDIVYNHNVCIEHVDRYGIVKEYNTMSSGCLLGRKYDSIDKYKEVLSSSGDDLKGIKLVNPDYDTNSLLYGVNVSNGYVYIYTTLENVDRTSIIVNGQMIYIVIITIIIALLVAFFLAKKISNPIVKITNQAREMANGNYNIDFYKNGIYEIDELADTLKYLQSEVSKTDQYRRDLMANVSHDLKTPLTMIKAYSEMIRDISYKDEKKREEHLNIIINETDRLNILVGDILELSKAQANVDDLEITDYDLADEINEIVKRYQIIKETENYVFELDIPQSINISADKNKINQVIYNLINNAINHTGEDNKVMIRVIECKNDYLIEIVDTGKGIGKDDIKHIWDRYYKKDKNHKRNVVGTGLGLSIVKSILEKHNFKYGVWSKINKGTTFYFRIKK